MKTVMLSMKTVMLYDNGEGLPQFYLLDGDLSHLHEVWLNVDDDADKEEELTALAYDEEFKFKHKPIEREDAIKAIRDGATLIVCGEAL